jgi:hypothetical protein
VAALLAIACGHNPPADDDGLLEPGAAEAVPAADQDCLDLLDRWQVPYLPVGKLRGVRTPIEIIGPIGGVRLVRRAGRAPQMDCELARALAETVPLFRELGVTGLSFSGAYDYRVRRGSTQLSAHAHGLAIDVHAFETASGSIDVSNEFPLAPARWRAWEHRPEQLGACVGRPGRPVRLLLRTLACRLAVHPAYRVILTPDDNADHWNHLHLEAFPGAAGQLYSAVPTTAAHGRRTRRR